MTRIAEDNDPTSNVGAAAEPGVGLPSAARRRALLKGLGKGAALAGAAVPLSSLATSGQRMRLKKSNDTNGYECSVSGNMSVMHSAGTSAVPECSGRAILHFAPSGDVPGSHMAGFNKGQYWPNWRKDAAGNAVCFKHAAEGTSNACFPRTAFGSVFGSGSSTKLGSLCKGEGSADERTWVTALLNSSVYPVKYPYSPQEVVKLYADSNTRANALVFFRDYLSSG